MADFDDLDDYPLSRPDWAWEFLRRNPEFQARASAASAPALSAVGSIRFHLETAEPQVGEAWGLATFPGPDETGAGDGCVLARGGTLPSPYIVVGNRRFGS